MIEGIEPKTQQQTNKSLHNTLNERQIAHIVCLLLEKQNHKTKDNSQSVKEWSH